MHTTRVTIDHQIQELIDVLSDNDIMVRMSNHQRMSLFTQGLPMPAASNASEMCTCKLSINQLVEVHLKGGVFYLMNSNDYVRIYEALHKYVLLWAQRSHVMKEDAMPPIEEFVSMDEFLAMVYPEYVINRAADVNYRPPKETRGTFKRRSFSGHAETVAGHQGVSVGRYVSLMSKFHDSAWENSQ